MARYRARFTDAVADDLATPKALAIAHEVAAASELTDGQRRALLLDFDHVLGLDLVRLLEVQPLPAGADELLVRRAAARAARDYATAGALREELAELSVEVPDRPSGQEASVRWRTDAEPRAIARAEAGR